MAMDSVAKKPEERAGDASGTPGRTTCHPRLPSLGEAIVAGPEPNFSDPDPLETIRSLLVVQGLPTRVPRAILMSPSPKVEILAQHHVEQGTPVAWWK